MAVRKAAFVVAGPVVCALAATWFLLPLPDRLVISDVTLAPLENGAAAVFLTIDNPGEADKLIGVSSPGGVAQLHAPETAAGLAIPGGDTAFLAADGAHIRLETEQKLTIGQLVPVALTFERAGQVTAKARVVETLVTGGADEAGLFGLGGICRVGKDEPGPEVSLAVVRSEDGWNVTVRSENFEFSEAMVGAMHIPGMGHGHLYLNGVKLGRLYSETAEIGVLPPGRHVVQVSLNTNDHRAYVREGKVISASAEIRIEE